MSLRCSAYLRSRSAAVRCLKTPPDRQGRAQRAKMAEREGFVPAIPAPINDLGLIRSPQTTKSTQSLSIRYKTGTAQSRRPGIL